MPVTGRTPDEQERWLQRVDWYATKRWGTDWRSIVSQREAEDAFGAWQRRLASS